MPAIPSRARECGAIAILTLGFFVLQFIFELGAISYIASVSNSLSEYPLATQIALIIIHIIVSIILFVLAKQIVNAHYKKNE